MVNLEGWFISDNLFEEAPQRAKTWIENVNNIKGFKPMKNLDEAIQRLLKNDPLLDNDFAKHLAEEIIKEQEDGLIWTHDPLHKTRSPQLSYYGQIKEFLDKIICPVLLIESDNTFFDLESYEKFLELYKNSEKLKIKDAGHNLHIHKPKEIGEKIIRFLENN